MVEVSLKVGQRRPIPIPFPNSQIQTMTPQTEFEKRRGVSRVEVRSGFAQAHLSNLGVPLAGKRLEVLEQVAKGGISIDFLKMTPMGLSFLIKAAEVDALHAVLKALNLEYSLRDGRSVVLVHAVNIRDEEGLIAGILKAAISGGTTVHHISDMHDRVLMVVESSEAEKLADTVKAAFMEAVRAN